MTSMAMEDVFRDALLAYILANVDRYAVGIEDVTTFSGRCVGHDVYESCCCDTAVKVNVDYEVEISGKRYLPHRTWIYEGDFFALIRMLDGGSR